jgi:hypothetical protein
MMVRIGNAAVRFDFWPMSPLDDLPAPSDDESRCHRASRFEG